jgi:hypothetical protein
VLSAIAGALVLAPAAHAATLSVDDDGQDCPAAAFATIQAAVDAAAAGDTVAICPGTYAEGSGQSGTNALTITRNLTLKGAGADLVRIRPRRTTATSGQIAEASPDIRNGVGDIIAVNGETAFPVTVNISGVTVEGNGVYVEAGIVYLDAQGTISRSRVTGIVTSEAADAYNTVPGGWRGPQYGYGIAQVTAAPTAPGGAGVRTLSILNTRVDKYNRVGVVFDAANNDGEPVVNSGIDNRGVVNASEVVGRALCQNYAANGNCSAPGLVTTGPLFGQDGIRVSGGARALITGSSITQNLTNGTNAPVRQTFSANGTETNPGTAGHENLWRSAGVRMVAADAANSQIARNNILDNGYGVFNVLADGTTDNPVPVDAPDNYWGRRFTPPATNSGPAISPANNPPVPENPVNGTPVVTADGTTSSSVDFLPYRSGPQSDPTTGQYPNIQAPMPVSDAAPTAALAVDDDTVDRGQVVNITATAADDFGVKSVTFYDGATKLGTVTTPPYTFAYTIPADAPCAARTLSVVVEDSAGQTASALTGITVVGPNNCQPVAGNGGGGGGGGGTTPPTPPGPAPTVTLPETLPTIVQAGTPVTVTPNAPNGVAKVEYFLGNRLVCTITTAPFTCRIVPLVSEVGLQTLRVVVTDKAGLTTVTTRQVLVGLFKSRGVSISIKYERASRGRVRRTITARVLLPLGATAKDACSDSRINLVVTRKFRPFSNTQPSLDIRCSARLRITSPRSKKKIYAISARFGGNTVLLPATKSRRFS